MAVDPKTGKPILDDMAEAERLIGRMNDRLLSDDILEEGDSPEPPPPDVGPRGVSVPRGAYGPWLAAQEWAKAEAKRQP